MYEGISLKDVSQGGATQAAPDPAPLRKLRCGLPRGTFDEEYVSRLRDGDPATEQHFTAYFGELLLIKLRARLGSREAMEDVRQETFLRVLAALKSLRRPESLGAFVNAVSENVLLEWYRKNPRPLEWDDRFEPPDYHSSPESEIITEQRKQHIRKVLGELPVKDRELIRMIFFEEADLDEVCRSFRVNRDYLRVLVHRAKARFRESLRKQSQEVRNA